VNCAREVEALRVFADAESLWLDPSSLGAFHRGRREHDLFGYGVEDWVFKITRGAGYGLVPMPLDVVSGMISDWFGVLPATPSQYFERLLLSNELYPGLNSLEGFCEWEDRFCIVTSQPFIAGRNATDREIALFMESRGFTRLCEATWFRPGDDLAIFDVGGSNLFIDETGSLVPIDVIPMVADGPLLETLRRAFRQIRPAAPGPSV
jgi:hypothetical protein